MNDKYLTFFLNLKQYYNSIFINSQIRKGAEYIPLEVLGKLEINEKRAVVLVNYKLEELVLCKIK